MESTLKTRRGQRSTIEKLPDEIVDKVNALIKKGRTIDEITDKLNELGADISRSAVGRYTKRAKDRMAKLKEAQAVAKIWVDKMGEEPDGDVGRLVAELLRFVAYQTATQWSDSKTPAKAGEVMSLAIAMEKLSRIKQIDLNVYIDRKKIQEQTKAAAQKITKEIKKAGLSEEMAELVRQQVLGIGN